MKTVFEKGDKVHYTSPHSSKENGIIKEVREKIAFVVYKCDEQCGDYENYTGQATNLEDLTPGWIGERTSSYSLSERIKNDNNNDDSDLNGKPYSGWTSGAWVKPYTHY